MIAGKTVHEIISDFLSVTFSSPLLINCKCVVYWEAGL
jgi:hypothetical protein